MGFKRYLLHLQGINFIISYPPQPDQHFSTKEIEILLINTNIEISEWLAGIRNVKGFSTRQVNFEMKKNKLCMRY